MNLCKVTFASFTVCHLARPKQIGCGNHRLGNPSPNNVGRGRRGQAVKRQIWMVRRGSVIVLNVDPDWPRKSKSKRLRRSATGQAGKVRRVGRGSMASRRNLGCYRGLHCTAGESAPRFSRWCVMDALPVIMKFK